MDNLPKVLSEISNKSSTSRKQVTTNATKYLVDTNAAKSVSKSSKKNFMVKGTKNQGRGGKKNYRLIDVVQLEGVVEELDDYAVLQSLHKNLVESEKVGEHCVEASFKCYYH